MQILLIRDRETCYSATLVVGRLLAGGGSESRSQDLTYDTREVRADPVSFGGGKLATAHRQSIYKTFENEVA